MKLFNFLTTVSFFGMTWRIIFMETKGIDTVFMVGFFLMAIFTAFYLEGAKMDERKKLSSAIESIEKLEKLLSALISRHDHPDKT